MARLNVLLFLVAIWVSLAIGYDSIFPPPTPQILQEESKICSRFLGFEVFCQDIPIIIADPEFTARQFNFFLQKFLILGLTGLVIIVISIMTLRSKRRGRQ